MVVSEDLAWLQCWNNLPARDVQVSREVAVALMKVEVCLVDLTFEWWQFVL